MRKIFENLSNQIKFGTPFDMCKGVEQSTAVL